LYKVGNEGNDKLDVYSIPFTVPVEKYFDLGLYFIVVAITQSNKVQINCKNRI